MLLPQTNPHVTILPKPAGSCETDRADLLPGYGAVAFTENGKPLVLCRYMDFASNTGHDLDQLLVKRLSDSG